MPDCVSDCSCRCKSFREPEESKETEIISGPSGYGVTTIKLPSCDPDVLKHVLRYVYCGRVSLRCLWSGNKLSIACNIKQFPSDKPERDRCTRDIGNRL